MIGAHQNIPYEPARIADELRRLAQDVERLGAPATSFGNARLTRPGDPLRFAQRIIDGRRRRKKHFDAIIFHDPTWDILLDLFVANETGKQVSVSSACIAADVPASTALRYVTFLVSTGLVTRDNDPNDGRRALLSLSPAGRSAMTSYLQAELLANGV